MLDKTRDNGKPSTNRTQEQHIICRLRTRTKVSIVPEGGIKNDSVRKLGIIAEHIRREGFVRLEFHCNGIVSAYAMFLVNIGTMGIQTELVELS